MTKELPKKASFSIATPSTNSSFSTREPADMKSSVPRRSSLIEKSEHQRRIDEKFINFTTTTEKYRSKPIDRIKEKAKLDAFVKYMEDDDTAVKMSRGVDYVLWREPCEYKSATEAFRINAYDEREGEAKLDRIRKERDDLKLKYRSVMAEMVALETEKIRLKRRLRDKDYEPVVVARSSGHPCNSYVHGYGYVYGIGYTDTTNPSTAPGFELTATDHVTRLVKKFSPIIGLKDFNKLYNEIFNFRKRRKHKQSISFQVTNVDQLIRSINY